MPTTTTTPVTAQGRIALGEQIRSSAVAGVQSQTSSSSSRQLASSSPIRQVGADDAQQRLAREKKLREEQEAAEAHDLAMRSQNWINVERHKKYVEEQQRLLDAELSREAARKHYLEMEGRARVERTRQERDYAIQQDRLWWIKHEQEQQQWRIQQQRADGERKRLQEEEEERRFGAARQIAAQHEHAERIRLQSELEQEERERETGEAEERAAAVAAATAAAAAAPNDYEMRSAEMARREERRRLVLQREGLAAERERQACTERERQHQRAARERAEAESERQHIEELARQAPPPESSQSSTTRMRIARGRRTRSEAQELERERDLAAQAQANSQNSEAVERAQRIAAATSQLAEERPRSASRNDQQRAELPRLERADSLRAAREQAERAARDATEKSQQSDEVKYREELARVTRVSKASETMSEDVVPTLSQDELLLKEAELKKLLEKERKQKIKQDRRRSRSTPKYKESEKQWRQTRSKEREAERAEARKTEVEYVRKKLGLGATETPKDVVTFTDKQKEEMIDQFGYWENWTGRVPRLIETPPTPLPGLPRGKSQVHVVGFDVFGPDARRELRIDTTSESEATAAPGTPAIATDVPPSEPEVVCAEPPADIVDAVPDFDYDLSAAHSEPLPPLSMPLPQVAPVDYPTVTGMPFTGVPSAPIPMRSRGDVSAVVGYDSSDVVTERAFHGCALPDNFSWEEAKAAHALRLVSGANSDYFSGQAEQQQSKQGAVVEARYRQEVKETARPQDTQATIGKPEIQDTIYGPELPPAPVTIDKPEVPANLSWELGTATGSRASYLALCNEVDQHLQQLSEGKEEKRNDREEGKSSPVLYGPELPPAPVTIDKPEVPANLSWELGTATGSRASYLALCNEVDQHLQQLSEGKEEKRNDREEGKSFPVPMAPTTDLQQPAVKTTHVHNVISDLPTGHKSDTREAQEERRKAVAAEKERLQYLDLGSQVANPSEVVSEVRKHQALAAEGRQQQFVPEAETMHPAKPERQIADGPTQAPEQQQQQQHTEDSAPTKSKTSGWDFFRNVLGREEDKSTKSLYAASKAVTESKTRETERQSTEVITSAPPGMPSNSPETGYNCDSDTVKQAPSLPEIPSFQPQPVLPHQSNIGASSSNTVSLGDITPTPATHVYSVVDDGGFASTRPPVEDSVFGLPPAHEGSPAPAVLTEQQQKEQDHAAFRAIVAVTMQEIGFDPGVVGQAINPEKVGPSERKAGGGSTAFIKSIDDFKNDNWRRRPRSPPMETAAGENVGRKLETAPAEPYVATRGVALVEHRKDLERQNCM